MSVRTSNAGHQSESLSMSDHALRWLNDRAKFLRLEKEVKAPSRGGTSAIWLDVRMRRWSLDGEPQLFAWRSRITPSHIRVIAPERSSDMGPVIQLVTVEIEYLDSRRARRIRGAF
jgi:hypothetical protein